MNINELIIKQNITKYKLSKESGVPHTTINDICSGKAKIEKCSAETLYKLAGTLNVSIESLIEDRLKGAETVEYRSSFETFKSNIGHYVRDMGDLDFIIDTLKSDKIRKYYNQKWYPESLYLLAMLDYLSRENELPICTNYNDIRAAKLKETLYPADILLLCDVSNSDKPKRDSLNEAIPEFMRFNIVESDVRNVI